MSTQRLDHILLPILLVSMSGTIAIGLVLIWTEWDSRTLHKLLYSFGFVALASGFLLSATRLGGSGLRHDP